MIEEQVDQQQIPAIKMNRAERRQYSRNLPKSAPICPICHKRSEFKNAEDGTKFCVVNHCTFSIEEVK